MNDLKSWPFVEARKVLEHTKDKDIAVFATGYGPSGSPHIGTFGEVARTTMVMNAFRQLTDKPMKLIVFSDDMDALRAVPDNVHNPDNILDDYIDVPLSMIPDTYGRHDSYSAHNNAELCRFLDIYEFDYEFMSSSVCYKSGIFNETLALIADNIDDIKEIVTKDYGVRGGNRKETYCPFLPIIDGRVVHDVYDYHVMRFNDGNPQMLHFFNEALEGSAKDSNRQAKMVGLYNGNCKLQWKVDWPMRWIALGIDYEMHGKDLIGSAQVGQRICKLLGKKAPINYMYELFLDENNEKISKSKGNGLDLHAWSHYTMRSALSYYMFQNPRKSRKLHFGVIPQMTDDYLKMLDKYHTTPDMDNPVWHIHNGDVPETGSPVSFSMLLNLVSITNTEDPTLMWEFVRNYVDATPEMYPMLDTLIRCAIGYYTDKVLPFKVYRDPEVMEAGTLMHLQASLFGIQSMHKAMLENMKENPDKLEEVNESGGEQVVLEEAITNAVYNVGKMYYGEEKDSLRNFFRMVYEVILGQTSGPRLPVFIMLLGIDKFVSIIEEKTKDIEEKFK